MNVYAPFFALAREKPSLQAVASDAGNLTYGELGRAVCWTAAEFARAGLRPGDRVAIALGPQLQYLVTSLALARLGAAQVAIQHTDSPLLWADLHRRLGFAATVAAPGTPLPARLEPPPQAPPDLRALPP